MLSMGGGKPKKPLSALDKQRRKEAKLIRKSKEERKVLPSLIDNSLIRRAERTVKTADLVTPSILASALNVKVSVARKLIKMLAEKGILNIVDKSRELIIAVPKSKSSS